MVCEWIGWCALEPEAQAAWVQAVGSVAAIVAAITIASSERSAAKKVADKQERAEANMRYTRAHRAVRRFQKGISAQLNHARVQRTGSVIVPMPPAPISREMRAIEHECHLMPDAGGEILTAINFFEEAQDLLRDGLLMPQDADRFVELLEYAEQRRVRAVGLIEAFLSKAQA
ncbi:hypothetical protein [Stenotrophomonas sp. SORGH_AS_0321]|uniref:hypothetical protein n=1 Tax=Stenotrophomonas sp. SORGH_AS_0321 TaxID=3041787 RepID=UPI0028637111|nr:hypothetical protein [Stenotrophomonas sp. SORGH_AS_0321]MDR6094918.1 hypothetical protein [Stenotrophomonas sp. SORGH_AS_0321]